MHQLKEGESMIDIHSHILPGIDDGAKNQAEMLEMAREAVEDGITAIIATPHHRNGSYNNPGEQVKNLVSIANQTFKIEGIPLTLHPGQEVRIYEDLLADLKREELLYLGERSRYLLLELPSHSVPPRMEHLIYDLLLLGIRPIIPHPERNSAIREQPNLLYRMVKAGAASQVTAGSLTEAFGKSIQKFCHSLLDHNLVHLIASDAHHTGIRGPKLSAAYKELERLGGYSLARDLRENAEKILSGQELYIDEPVKFTRKKVFGIF